MKVIFEEYFKNLDNWNFEHGFVRNEELQYYTNNNIELYNGLKIYGKKEKVENELYYISSNDWRKSRKFAYYTSSSLNTKDKFEFLYGVVEVKAKIPVANGAWPAIWMLGSDKEWPLCDEVDIMEYYLYDDKPSILANFMYSNNGECIWNTGVVPLDYFKYRDNNWDNKFHIWKLDWQKEYLKIYLDEELINSIDIRNINNEDFRRKHYLLINLAIGKDHLVPDDKDLPFIYEIEYIKVYQE